jgi:hypothetical protein
VKSTFMRTVALTFTTIAFDDSSLRWLEISTDCRNSKDLPSSLVQLRIAVWTGVTRGARPEAEIAAYSINSSTRTRIDCGTVRPSALAVSAFKAISNFTGS